MGRNKKYGTETIVFGVRIPAENAEEIKEKIRRLVKRLTKDATKQTTRRSHRVYK